MKRITVSISVVVILFTVLVSSCSKSSTASNAGTVSFTASGTNYSYSAGTGMIGHATGNSLQFVKNESNSSQNTLSFSGGNDASGTYAFSPSTNLQWSIGGKIYTSLNPSTSTATGSISVNITGSTATATFNTVLYNITNSADVVTITNGNFSGSFIAQ